MTPLAALRALRNAGYACQARNDAGVRCNAPAPHARTAASGALIAVCTDHL